MKPFQIWGEVLIKSNPNKLNYPNKDFVAIFESENVLVHKINLMRHQIYLNDYALSFSFNPINQYYNIIGDMNDDLIIPNLSNDVIDGGNKINL